MILGIPEYDAMFESVWFCEGIHHCIGEITPLEKRTTIQNSRRVSKLMFVDISPSIWLKQYKICLSKIFFKHFQRIFSIKKLFVHMHKNFFQIKFSVKIFER